MVIYEDQNLVTGGGGVRVTALQNSFQESGTGKQAVELLPVENASVGEGNFTGEIDIRLPTRLNGSYWDDEIPTSLRTNPATAVNESAYPADPDVYQLELTVNATDLRFNTVGINSVPQDDGESLQQNVGAGSGVGGGDGGSGGDGGTGDDGGSGGGGGGDPLPTDAVAFDDQNGDGVYDSGETTYTESEAASLDNQSVDLVVDKDLSSNQVQITAATITIRDGVQVQAASGQLTLRTASGDLTARGASIIAERNGNGRQLRLESAGNIDIRDAILQGGQMRAVPPSSGTLFVNANGGDRADGGTYLETPDGNINSLRLERGTQDGTPERGSIT